MIVTVSMNPSIDISYPLTTFQLDTVNRVTNVKKTAGGKGLNVTRVLKQAGTDVVAAGVIGGSLGEDIQAQLDEAGIEHAFSKIAGQTRNCIAILHEGQQTEILESGPVITESEAADFLLDFETLIEAASIVVISGSLPAGLPQDFYAQMIAICSDKNKPVILDCSGDSLRLVLASAHKPLLIKPNTEELADLLSKDVTADIATLKAVLSESLFEGIEWIVVSMGAQGAFAKHHDRFYQVSIPKIAVVNPVGSGDATVAGLAAAIANDDTDENILKRANVFGMLNAQEPLTGHVNMDNYQTLFEQVRVTEL